MGTIKRYRLMKTTQNKTIKKVWLLLFFITGTLGVNAQEYKTNFIQDLIGKGIDVTHVKTFNGENKSHKFPNLQHADLILLTTHLDEEDIDSNYPSNNYKPIYRFFKEDDVNLSTSVPKVHYSFEILLKKDVEKNEHSFVLRRYYGLLQNDAGILPPTNPPYLEYEIYDDVAKEGFFTFLISEHFTLIALEELDPSSEEWVGYEPDIYSLAPVFFGMDSTVQFDGNDVQSKFVSMIQGASNKSFFFNTTDLWIMNRSYAQLQPVLNKLQIRVENSRALNAKQANTKVLNTKEYENNLVENVQLYPNPSNGKFYLNFALKENGPVKFEIFNLAGRKVLEQTGNNFSSGNNKYELDATGKLFTGFYTLNITSSEFSERIKLIVE